MTEHSYFIVLRPGRVYTDPEGESSNVGRLNDIRTVSVANSGVLIFQDHLAHSPICVMQAGEWRSVVRLDWTEVSEGARGKGLGMHYRVVPHGDRRNILVDKMTPQVVDVYGVGRVSLSAAGDLVLHDLEDVPLLIFATGFWSFADRKSDPF